MWAIYLLAENHAQVAWCFRLSEARKAWPLVSFRVQKHNWVAQREIRTGSNSTLLFFRTYLFWINHCQSIEKCCSYWFILYLLHSYVTRWFKRPKMTSNLTQLFWKCILKYRSTQNCCPINLSLPPLELFFLPYFNGKQMT